MVAFARVPRYASAQMRRVSPLAWIIAFKAFKAVTLTALGAVLLATRHEDPVDVLTRLALAVHMPLSSELFDRAMKFALNLTVRKQTAIAVTAFGYAALMGSEGVALYLRKPWARWFTVGATSSMLPYRSVRDRPRGAPGSRARTPRKHHHRNLPTEAQGAV